MVDLDRRALQESATGRPRGHFEDQAWPWSLANHHRRPTNKNRQSRKNSGGLPSNACPTNWSSQPTANKASANLASPPNRKAVAISSNETTIIGIPNV